MALTLVKDELELTSEQLFMLFWEQYPKKVGKIKARMEWQKLNRAQQQMAVEAIPKFAAQLAKVGTEWEYILHAERWLKYGRYEDEYELNLPAPTPCRWSSCTGVGKHQHGTASYCEKHFLALKRGESPGR